VNLLSAIVSVSYISVFPADVIMLKRHAVKIRTYTTKFEAWA